MAKLADAADLKSADPYRSWGFKSPSGHQNPRGPSALLGISPAGLDARQAAQVQVPLWAP